MHIDRYKQGDSYVDEEGAEWEGVESFIQGALLGFCTCGNPWESLTFVRDVLKHVQMREGSYEQWKESGSKIASQAILYFAWYVLNEKGFLEHGGCVPGWLTQSGAELLDDLNEMLDGDSHADTGYGTTMQIQSPSTFEEGAIQQVEVKFMFEPKGRANGDS